MHKAILLLSLLLGLISQPVQALTLSGNVKETGNVDELAPAAEFTLSVKTRAVPEMQVSLDPNCGQDLRGCLGCYVDFQSGRIGIIYPYSHAPEYGIRVGDFIITEENRPFDGAETAAVCRGVPGTPIHLVMGRGTQTYTVDVPRCEARRLVNDSPYYRELARGDRYW